MNTSKITTKNNWVIEDFILIEKISETPFSTVWRANHRKNPDSVDLALKKIPLSKLTPNLKASLDCEINFLSTVNHPNIIHFLGFFQAEGCLFLVFEFCDGGNLASYIRRRGGVHEQIARDFMHQLGAGLRIMRSHQIIHRDLKPQNILLSCSDSSTLLKIADFGLSRVLHSGDYAETVCGSPLYMAPEMLGFQRYDDKVDMWSIGVILFELLNGYPPFHGRTNVQLLKNIKTSIGLPFSQLILQKIHPDCFNMCSRLLCVNPADRLSFEEFYCHRFFMQTKEGPTGRDLIMDSWKYSTQSLVRYAGNKASIEAAFFSLELVWRLTVPCLPFGLENQIFAESNSNQVISTLYTFHKGWV